MPLEPQVEPSTFSTERRFGISSEQLRHLLWNSYRSITVCYWLIRTIHLFIHSCHAGERNRRTVQYRTVCCVLLYGMPECLLRTVLPYPYELKIALDQNTSEMTGGDWLESAYFFRSSVFLYSLKIIPLKVNTLSSYFHTVHTRRFY